MKTELQDGRPLGELLRGGGAACDVEKANAQGIGRDISYSIRAGSFG